MLTALLVLLVSATLARADAPADYAALLAAFNNKDWTRTLDLAEAFVKDHADYRHVHAAYYMGGNAGVNSAQYERGEAMYRALLAKHLHSRHVGKARNELVNLLANARRLDDCIKQCRSNLEAEPEAIHRDDWRWRIGECQFRLWAFKEAEASLKAFLEGFPQSRHRARAQEHLAMINPPLKVGPGRVVEGYAGKYTHDVRFARELRALPGYVGAAWSMLRITLGLELSGKCEYVIEFRDKGFTREFERAVADTIALDYKPVTRIVFYTEHVVLSSADFRSRVIHELKHAAFRGAMGQAYLDRPRWVREGLAVYGAGQTKDRIAAVLGNEVFAGSDPRRVLDGIDDADHNVTDYIEDALAFAWLETRKKGAVHEYCRRLLAGEPYDKTFAALAGMEFAKALTVAADWIKTEIDVRLGKAEREFVSLQSEHVAASSRDGEGAWATGGIARYEGWLKANPDHLLVPNARYRLGRALIAAGRHEDARRILALVAAEELRCTLTDDAQFRIARSFEIEGKAAEARAAYGVLLRDYCWSAHAIALQDKHQAAGPVKE